MKWLFPGIFFLCFFVVPTASWADHDLVFIRSLVKFNDTTCSVELEIYGDDQDGFTDADNVKIDGEVLVNFSGLVAGGINESGANHNAGDRILIASSAFNSNILRGDITFNNDQCERFSPDSFFSYNIDGDILIDSIDTAQFTGFGFLAVFQKGHP